MSQTLALDLCRRFTFGLTIENEGFRIWFCDRSGYMVSKPCEYSNSVRLFLYALRVMPDKRLCQDTIITIFARLSTATEEQLGYDLSVTRVLDRYNTPQYDIRVDSPLGPRVFRTMRLLANHSLVRAVGRSTRVWEVYEGQDEDDKPTFALKDTWVENSRTREGSIYAIVKEGTTPEQQSCFLTLVCDGDVKLTSGDPDTTLGTRQGNPPLGTLPVMDRPCYSLSLGPVIDHPDGASPGPPEITPKPQVFTDRAHYRIVFQEVGVPLSRLRDLGEIWRALCDANDDQFTSTDQSWRC
jgi:hypothetical protein